MSDAAQDPQDEQRQRADRFRAVFGTPAGQTVLDELRRFARYGQTKIGEDSGGRVDPGKTLVFCGMETVIIFIEDQLQYHYKPRPTQADMGDDEHVDG